MAISMGAMNFSLNHKLKKILYIRREILQKQTERTKPSLFVYNHKNPETLITDQRPLITTPSPNSETPKELQASLYR